MPQRRTAAQKKTPTKAQTKGEVVSFDKRASEKKSAEKKAGPQAEPKPPFPEQHQSHPGIEAEVEPRPQYQARAIGEQRS